MPEPLDARLRDALGSTRGTELPAGLLETVGQRVRSTPQVQSTSASMRWMAAIAGVFVVVVLVTGGPLLYGIVQAPGGTPAGTGVVASGTPGPAQSPSNTPSPTPSATPLLTPKPTPFGSPSTSFDLRATAWRLVELPGQALTEVTTPWIAFLLATGPNVPRTANLVTGFDGCSLFPMQGAFDRGQITGLSIGDRDPLCRPTAARDAFVVSLSSMTGWVVIGDFLILSSPAGMLQFVRDLPPPGDAGRLLADTLEAAPWRITAATGVKAFALYPAVSFGDHVFAAGGSCGFGGQVTFFAGGGVKLENSGFDTIYCSPEDERPALIQLLNTATSGVVDSPIAVRFTAPNGEVGLTRQ